MGGWWVCFFFNDTATTEIYTLSLHDALPICWLQIHLIVATPLAILIVAWIWFHQVRLDLVKASAWLGISTGLGLIVIPMVGLTGTESTHHWVQGHGWLSFLGVGLLGLSAAMASRKKVTELKR